LSSLLLSGVQSQFEFLWSILSSSIFCLISMVQLFALGVAVCSGIDKEPEVISVCMFVILAWWFLLVWCMCG
jgi:hypothetical protein